MENKESITINLNFIINTVNTKVTETIVEQVLNLDHDQLIMLAAQQEKGEHNG